MCVCVCVWILNYNSYSLADVSLLPSFLSHTLSHTHPGGATTTRIDRAAWQSCVSLTAPSSRRRRTRRSALPPLACRMPSTLSSRRSTLRTDALSSDPLGRKTSCACTQKPPLRRRPTSLRCEFSRRCSISRVVSTRARRRCCINSKSTFLFVCFHGA